MNYLRDLDTLIGEKVFRCSVSMGMILRREEGGSPAWIPLPHFSTNLLHALDAVNEMVSHGQAAVDRCYQLIEASQGALSPTDRHDSDLQTQARNVCLACLEALRQIEGAQKSSMLITVNGATNQTAAAD